MSYSVSIKNTLITPLKAVVAQTSYNIAPLATTDVPLPENVNMIEIRDSRTGTLKWENYVPSGVTLDIITPEGSSTVYGVILGDTKLASTSSPHSDLDSSSTNWWWMFGAVALALIIVIIVLAVFLSKKSPTSKRSTSQPARRQAYGSRRANANRRRS